MKYLGFIKSKVPGSKYFPVELVYVKKGLQKPEGKLFVTEENACGFENCFVGFEKIAKNPSMTTLSFMVDSRLQSAWLPVVVDITDTVDKYMENLKKPGPKVLEFFKANSPFYLRKNNIFLGAFSYDKQNNRICAADGRFVQKFEIKNSEALIRYKNKIYVMEDNLPPRIQPPVEFVYLEKKPVENVITPEPEIKNVGKNTADATLLELKNLQSKLQNIEKLNDRLENENKLLKERLSKLENKPVLYLNGENELFPGELKEFVLEILEKYNTDSGTRRSDVLKGIIANNNYQHLIEKRRQKIRELLNGYDGLSGTMRRELEELGLFISYEDGKHYKVRYYGDSRYWVTMAKTPSDSQRGDKNLVSKILKNML